MCCVVLCCVVLCSSAQAERADGGGRVADPAVRAEGCALKGREEVLRARKAVMEAQVAAARETTVPQVTSPQARYCFMLLLLLLLLLLVYC